MKQGSAATVSLRQSNEERPGHQDGPWYGETAVAMHMRTDMIMSNPMMTVVADMVLDNDGIGCFIDMPGHFTAGMRMRFHVPLRQTPK